MSGHGYTLPGDLPPEIHERAVLLLQRRHMLTNAEPMAAEAVRITEALDLLTKPRRSTGYKHSNSGYTGHGCRCPTCCQAHAEAQRSSRARRAGDVLV